MSLKLDGTGSVEFPDGSTLSQALSTVISDIENAVGTTTAKKLDKLLFPIGTILMFDGNKPAGGSGGASGAWVDNTTMVGWYSMVTANTVWGCTDMTDRFMMGKVIAGAGATGGSNTHTIASTNLPTHTHTLSAHTHTMPHTHNMNHAHSYSSFSSTGSVHTHTIAAGNGSHAHNIYYNTSQLYYLNTTAGSGAGMGGLAGGATQNLTAYTNTLPAMTTGNGSADHTHTLTIDAQNGASQGVNTASTNGPSSADTSNGAFTNTAITHTPSYYSIIYIRKCV